MLLNIFTEFDITTDWKWILLAVGIVIAIIVIIVMLKKHFKTMLFLVFLIGFAFLFYWANSKFAFSFSEDMACKEIVRCFDSDDYTSENHGDFTFYYRKTKDDNGQYISDSSDCFAVKKFWFTYHENSPMMNGSQAQTILGVNYFLLYKFYKAEDNLYILQIDAKTTTYITGSLGYIFPSVKAQANDKDVPLTKVDGSLYTYTATCLPDKLIVGSVTFDLKEAK